MKTEDRRICPRCGNEFSGALELCPVCALRGASDEETEPFSEQVFSAAVLKGGRNVLSTLNLSRAKTGSLSSWVAARWASLTKRWTSTCDAP